MPTKKDTAKATAPAGVPRKEGTPGRSGREPTIFHASRKNRNENRPGTKTIRNLASRRKALAARHEWKAGDRMTGDSSSKGTTSYYEAKSLTSTKKDGHDASRRKRNNK